jgi:SAM-dependent methyltransferase
MSMNKTVSGSKRCRHCENRLSHTLVDLGFAPPSNSYLEKDGLDAGEVWLPLRAAVCDSCWLVQTEDYATPSQLFSPDYAYFSSTSESWLAHSFAFFTSASERFSIGEGSFVVEIGSNDGYLLSHFINSGIPCLGIEPTRASAEAAKRLGVPVCVEFFGPELARRLSAEGKRADLIVGNNVFAHVPDINGFTEGMKTLLKEGGVISLEFPHLLNLIGHGQFDTIYHEHFSYLSLFTVQKIFESQGLKLFDVDLLSTHGGSLRVYGTHSEDPRLENPEVARVIEMEKQAGLFDLEIIDGFQERSNRTKYQLLNFLIAEKLAGRRTVAYGAAAKGNTLLNFAGVGVDLISECYDAAPSKQGKLLPGSHIPITAPPSDFVIDADNVLILPWNLAGEIVPLLSSANGERPSCYVAIPELQRLS